MEGVVAHNDRPMQHCRCAVLHGATAIGDITVKGTLYKKLTPYKLLLLIYLYLT